MKTIISITEFYVAKSLYLYFSGGSFCKGAGGNVDQVAEAGRQKEPPRKKRAGGLKKKSGIQKKLGTILGSSLKVLVT